MFEPSDSLRARRAARRAQLRRRRLIVTGGVALVLVAIAAAAVARAHHSSPPARAARRPATPPGPASAAPRRPAAAGKLSPQAKLEALGIARIKQFAKLGLPIYCGGSHGNEVAFTFDDGPGPYTYLALRKLAQAHQEATFFVVGRSLDNYPGWVERETKLAYIGDHTMTHPFLPGLSPSEVSFQLGHTKDMIEHATGQPVTLFRPPYGSHTPTVDGIAKQMGLLEILWADDSADSLGANWAGIIRNVEAGLVPGEIILMHENRGQTIRALTTILPELARRHMRSVSLPELFATDPPSVAQVRAGSRGCHAAGGLGSGS